MGERASVCFNERLESTQRRRITEVEEEGRASLHESIRTVRETQTTGAETLKTLYAQGEQLRRLQTSMDNVEIGLRQGDRYLRSIGSWFGALSNAFRSNPQPVHTFSRQTENLKFIPTTSSDSLMQNLQGHEAPELFESEICELSAGVSNLKEMALAMGTTLDDQAKTIEGLTEAVMNADAHLSQAQHKIRRAM